MVSNLSRAVNVAKYYFRLVPNKFLCWILLALPELLPVLFVSCMDYATRGSLALWLLVGFGQWEALVGDRRAERLAGNVFPWLSFPVLSSTEGQNSSSVILSYSPRSSLTPAPSSGPLGSRSGEAVAGSWVFYHSSQCLLILPIPLSIVPSFNFFQFSLLSIFLPEPWLYLAKR